GNYTERDIKEAARAFTGYRINQDAFHFAADQHDRGSKTVFGVPGRYDGDAVIDLAYEQPAAGRFVPAEMVKFYLSDTPLPPVYVSWLGDWWRSTGYDLRELAVRFFSSRLFHHPAFR